MTKQDYPSRVLQRVAQEYNLTVQELLGDARDHRTARARHVAMGALRNGGFSTPQIGALLHRDHSTVIHALRGTEAVRAEAQLIHAAVHNENDPESRGDSTPSTNGTGPTTTTDMKVEIEVAGVVVRIGFS